MWLIIMAVLLITFATSLALYLQGVKEMKGKTVVIVKNNPGYPRATPSGAFEHQGTFNMGNKDWLFAGSFLSPQIQLICQDGQVDYHNGSNCTLNPSYAQAQKSMNFKIMITSIIAFVLCVIYLIKSRLFTKKQQTKQRNNKTTQ